MVFNLQLLEISSREFPMHSQSTHTPTHYVCKPIKTVSVCAVADCSGSSSVYISLSCARPCQTRLYHAPLRLPSTDQRQALISPVSATFSTVRISVCVSVCLCAVSCVMIYFKRKNLFLHNFQVFGLTVSDIFS